MRNPNASVVDVSAAGGAHILQEVLVAPMEKTSVQFFDSAVAEKAKRIVYRNLDGTRRGG